MIIVLTDPQGCEVGVSVAMISCITHRPTGTYTVTLADGHGIDVRESPSEIQAAIQWEYALSQTDILGEFEVEDDGAEEAPTHEEVITELKRRGELDD